MSEICALGLFSGGLDSLLAHRVIANLGIKVIGLKCITPFFDHDLLVAPEAYQKWAMDTYQIHVELVDLSPGYMQLLRNPIHGFGKNFNPCIDCKILMMQRAKDLMAHYNASFIFSGEVLGQRPMSQRKDTLRIIERDSGCDDILLRPLCAQRLNPTRPEREGLVDREKLYGFVGRGRKEQIALARELGITHYPAPAGGCVLTDPNLARRIRLFYEGELGIEPENFQVKDIRFLLFGRQFLLPGKQWLILGRNERENDALADLRSSDDLLLRMEEHPGPTGIVRHFLQKDLSPAQRKITLDTAAGLIVRYGKKTDGYLLPGVVTVHDGTGKIVTAAPLDDKIFTSWQF